MTQYIRAKNGEASEMMWDAGQGGAGPWVSCNCGIDHSLPCEEDDNFDRSDMFYYIIIDGQHFVYDCEGCKTTLARYENFIWNNKDTIRRYLKTRIDQEKAWAEQQHLLNILADIK